MQARKATTAWQVIGRYMEMVSPFFTPKLLRALATLNTAQRRLA
jgi:hypothetical protein